MKNLIASLFLVFASTGCGTYLVYHESSNSTEEMTWGEILKCHTSDCEDAKEHYRSMYTDTPARSGVRYCTDNGCFGGGQPTVLFLK